MKIEVPDRVMRGMRDLMPDELRVERASLSDVGGVSKQNVRSVFESARAPAGKRNRRQPEGARAESITRRTERERGLLLQIDDVHKLLDSNKALAKWEALKVAGRRRQSADARSQENQTSPSEGMATHPVVVDLDPTFLKDDEPLLPGLAPVDRNLTLRLLVVARRKTRRPAPLLLDKHPVCWEFRDRFEIETEVGGEKGGKKVR